VKDEGQRQEEREYRDAMAEFFTSVLKERSTRQERNVSWFGELLGRAVADAESRNQQQRFRMRYAPHETTIVDWEGGDNHRF
jgi:hypothetical protein